MEVSTFDRTYIQGFRRIPASRPCSIIFLYHCYYYYWSFPPDHAVSMRVEDTSRVATPRELVEKVTAALSLYIPETGRWSGPALGPRSYAVCLLCACLDLRGDPLLPSPLEGGRAHQAGTRIGQPTPSRLLHISMSPVTPPSRCFDTPTHLPPIGSMPI